MPEQDKADIIAALSAHMYWLKGGLAIGLVMGSLLLGVVSYQFIKIDSRVDRLENKVVRRIENKVAKNAKDIAVIRSEMRRINYKENQL